MIMISTDWHHISRWHLMPVRTTRFFHGFTLKRRVKKTVNFDDPNVYHLYYGDECWYPRHCHDLLPGIPRRDARQAGGVGEVSETQFAVPKGSLSFWQDQLIAKGAGNLSARTRSSVPIA